MNITVQFYSYFKELAGTPQTREEASPGTSLGHFMERLLEKYPRLAPMRKSMLVAVGVDYQRGDYILNDGDEVALFPPVQGG